MVKEGPFQNIVDVFFPDEGEPGDPEPLTTSVYVYFSQIFDEEGEFDQAFSGTVANITDVTRQYCIVTAEMTPPTIPTPADVEIGGLVFDPEQSRSYRTYRKVTGDRPQQSGNFIVYTDATNLHTVSGSTYICPVWTVEYRQYYFFLGIYSEIMTSLTESSVSFNASSVRLRSIDGVLYKGISFKNDAFKRLIVEKV